MGIFGDIFGKGDGDKGKEEAKIPWIALTNLNQLEEISEKSKGKPQVIFKHSTTCGISRMVLNVFTSGYSLEAGLVDFYFLDLLANREISNNAAQKFGVQHQSPQLLIIKNGVVVAHDSHGAINEIQIETYL